MVALRTGLAERARRARPYARIDLQTGRHAGRIRRPGGLASRTQISLSPGCKWREGRKWALLLAFRCIKPGRSAMAFPYGSQPRLAGGEKSNFGGRSCRSTATSIARYECFRL